MAVARHMVALSIAVSVWFLRCSWVDRSFVQRRVSAFLVDAGS
jgi:hypothetical protein